MRPRLAFAFLATIAVLLVPSQAGAATAPAKPKQLKSSVVVRQFVVRKTGLSALGTAATTVGGNSTKQAVTLRASTGSSSCQVLTLRLDRLNLALLGLRLDVSAVNLRITGNRARTLGALFCKLATATKLGNLTKARATAATLNNSIRHRPMPMIGFSALLYPQTVPAEGPPAAPFGPTSRQATTASGPTCPVLDLTLGPLSLDLLGLVVDLYGKTKTDPVQVTAVADPAAGILGKALCQISTVQPA